MRKKNRMRGNGDSGLKNREASGGREKGLVRKGWGGDERRMGKG